ncbi:hypothetical protein [Palleronia abyssalis]|uniref:Uncharacterized protein n=1 Tax=Palleronia abyssalis TaxID=1501240 RepID=A0A2R8BY20_9RHOB|nr:hypothetical protein [Palleronia abyssalis]SPJ25050.1 hypothetical protein PAA8504_02893 [Palleronia abyssalis]
MSYESIARQVVAFAEADNITVRKALDFYGLDRAFRKEVEKAIACLPATEPKEQKPAPKEPTPTVHFDAPQPVQMTDQKRRALKSEDEALRRAGEL